MKRLFRFPFTAAATVLTLIMVLAAVTGELDLDVLKIPLGVIGRIQRRWVDEILIAFVFLVAAIIVDVSRTRRVTAQRARIATAETERRFRALFAANPLPMWIYDLTTLRFLEVNDAAVQRYGYERDEFLAMTIKDIRPADDVERLLTDVAHAREAWQDAGDWRHRVKSGQIIDVEITSHTITFAGRSAALVVAQDVTTRKRTEEEIRNRAVLSDLTAAVGLALTNSDSLAHALQRCAEALVTHLGAAFARIWTVNEREGMLELQASAGLYTHLNGAHGKVPIGKFKIGRIAQNRTPHLTNAVIGDPEVNDQEWARQEGMVAFAGHPLILDGRVVGVMALFARHALSDAVIAALASVADHIALGLERHRSAAVLRTTEERMRFALEASRVGIWEADLTTGTSMWSDVLEALHGMPAGTFGRTLQAFVEAIHPDDRQAVRDAIEHATRTHTDANLLYRVQWPDGTLHWIRGTGRTFYAENGTPLRAAGVGFDVTEMQTLEEQYRQAQKMEAVGQLASGIAHDFNNLLTAILGYGTFVLEQLEPRHPARPDVQEVLRAAESAASLTRQLLAFSRRQILQPQILDLNTVVARAESLLRRLIGEDIELTCRPTALLGCVHADPGQIEQIIMNLAVNARDAMRGGGKLTIETGNIELSEAYVHDHHGASMGSHVVLAVSDTGVGMDEATRARIFEPFFTTKKRGEGTGLGLATVYGIVKQSGGSIWVYSELGRGTTFKIYFPRVSGNDPGTVTPAVVSTVLEGTETILVAEDQLGVRALIRSALARCGYRVLLASDGEQALQMARAHGHPIHLLLTDVVMPVMGGRELSQQLRLTHPETRVLYMSGYTDDAVIRHGVLEPHTAFLEKPFVPQALARKIRQVLDAPAE